MQLQARDGFRVHRGRLEGGGPAAACAGAQQAAPVALGLDLLVDFPPTIAGRHPPLRGPAATQQERVGRVAGIVQYGFDLHTVALDHHAVDAPLQAVDIKLLGHDDIEGGLAVGGAAVWALPAGPEHPATTTALATIRTVRTIADRIDPHLVIADHLRLRRKDAPSKRSLNSV